MGMWGVWLKLLKINRDHKTFTGQFAYYIVIEMQLKAKKVTK